MPAGSTRGPRSSLSDRAIEPPSPIPAGPRAWTDFGDGPGRERWILPFTAVLALGLVLAGLAAAISWIDWRWVLLGLCAVAVVLPCGVLALQGRLDLFEPLTWFAVMFLLLFVTRPAWDLGHENFIYTGRLISPTFTKMIVAGLLAGTGFVIGYLTPAGESLASRLPRPSTLDSRRLLIWSTLVFAVALAAFAAFFVQAHGWRDPAHFFFGQNRIRFKAIASTPEATSKYFLVSIVLMIPVALLFLSIRHIAGEGTRIRRLATWAALASILAFLLITFPAGQRRYVIGMLGALAVYYYLRRGRRPSALGVCVVALVALTVVSAIRDLRFADSQYAPRPGSVAALERGYPPLFKTQDTGVRPRSGAPRCSSCPRPPLHVWRERPCSGRSSRGPQAAVVGQATPANQQVLGSVWGGSPCTLRRPVQHVLALRGAVSRWRPRRRCSSSRCCSALLEGAWLYYLRHRDTVVAIIVCCDAAAVHDQLDAGELHPPGAAGRDGPGRRRDRRPALSPRSETRRRRCQPGHEAPAARGRSPTGGRIYSWSARRRPGPRPCTARWPGIRRSTCRR